MSNDNLALLAAAYGEFSEINNIKEIQKTLIKKVEISSAQAKNFTKTYEVLAHQPNTASGYSGTIVKNRNTKEIFVLHRGTEIDTYADWIEDGILVTGGLAHNWKKHAKINRL